MNKADAVLTKNRGFTQDCQVTAPSYICFEIKELYNQAFISYSEVIDRPHNYGVETLRTSGTGSRNVLLLDTSR